MGLKVLLKDRSYYASVGPQPIQLCKDMSVGKEQPKRWLLSGTIQTWDSEKDYDDEKMPSGSVTVNISLDAPPVGNIIDMIYAKYKSTIGDYVDDIDVKSK